MPQPALLVVTGASGAGKTTLVRGLELYSVQRTRCYFFDAIGVPAPDEMIRQYGSGEAWQAAMTARWVERLAAETIPGSLAVLDGQVRPSVVLDALAASPIPIVEIVLVDCSQERREERLRHPRGQPELATPAMGAWAAYLRGQADALGLPRIDTTQTTVDEGVAVLAQHARRLLTRAAA